MILSVSIKDNKRDSNFELLRIVAMFFIVFYHIIHFFIVPYHPEVPFYHAIEPSFHVGVILFVLISGYFQIRPTVKGIIKLLSLVAVYYIPLQIYSSIKVHDINLVITSFQFIKYTPYWFIRTYICLYLISPIINRYLEGLSNKRLWYLLGVLGFFSLYVGNCNIIQNADQSLIDGKNLLNFIFIYLLGYTLKINQIKIERIGLITLIIGYILLNISIVGVFSIKPTSSWIWKMCYSYNGIILIINSIILFCIFSKFHFNNKVINYISSSMFAVYLIHHQPLILNKIGELSNYLDKTALNKISLLGSLLLLTLIILIISVLIDKIISPIITRIIVAIVPNSILSKKLY